MDREQLIGLLDEVSKELQQNRTRAQIYVIGGAAMSLAFSRDRRTEDIDARIDRGHSELIKAVQRVGRRHGLVDSWVNEQATSAIPRQKDETRRTLYESPYLTVTGASAKHLLAMKLYAGRDKDKNDISTLVNELKLNEPHEAVRIYENLFPDEPLKETARDLLEGAFAQKPIQPGGDPKIETPPARPSKPTQVGAHEKREVKKTKVER